MIYTFAFKGEIKVKRHRYCRSGSFVLAATAFYFAAGPHLAFAVEPEDKVELLDTMSVTASRIERGTKEVPSSIAVIDEDRIEAAKMMNIKDAIQGTPGVLLETKNGGYDVRLIIRGAGQKAPYGVREIQVLRDGVPMTDPDSFTRFDFIDTQDMERIEITKGPGSLYAAGSAGGTIQIISKSVFDTEGNRIKLGLGEEGSENFNIRYAGMLDESNAFRVTASHRALDNDWRSWNAYDTQQLSLKHGFLFNDGATLETELSYSEADMELPGSMNEEQFDEYKKDGEQRASDGAWQNSGRYSTIWFFNTRYEREWGDFTFRPRLYYNKWEHYHPVTAAINDNPGTEVLGADLELVYRHQLLGDSTLVAGVTGRVDDTDGAKKYGYRDVVTGFGGRITSTLSDKKGVLLEEEDATNTIYGAYLQETVRPTDRLIADVGVRYDRMKFDVDTNVFQEYSWGAGLYQDVADYEESVDKVYHLWSPSVGLSYALTDTLNVYASAAESDQVPSESEIQANGSLEASTARNYEIGLKGRAENWSFDLAAYKTRVEDEIVSVYNGAWTEYENAGETDKFGVEFAGRFELMDNLWLGGSYAYSDYEFEKLIEPVKVYGMGPPVTTNMDRSGNEMPYVPRHQYSLSLDYSHPCGFKGRIQADSWGSYYMDNANTEKYEGYDFVTNLMLGYDKGPHSIALNVDNVFDKHYSVEAKKDTSGKKTYAGASPRIAMLTYTYNF